MDPHVYARGVNGLTVEEALERAFPRVMGILGRSGERYSEFERSLVRRAVGACLVAQVSRANLYRIAGILVADRRDEGAHAGASLAVAYVAALREAFLGDTYVGERVFTRHGAGEIRYISGDGEMAAISLDGASAGGSAEVWVPVAEVVHQGDEQLAAS